MAEGDDPYENVAKGKLQLKNTGIVKKKKKKHKEKQLLEQVSKAADNEEKTETKSDLKKTKAEMAFQKMQEKMVGFYF